MKIYKKLLLGIACHKANPIISLTIISLIIVGGIGFLTWDDIRANKHHFKHYRMQSKVILVTTGILIIVPAFYLFFIEFANLSVNERILASLFQAVTPRTAGFNTVGLNAILTFGIVSSY